MPEPPDESRLDELRRQLANSEHATLQSVVSELTPFHEQLRPRDKSEALPLFNQEGSFLGIAAPRWICHVMALRHRCAHILLTWKSPAVGETLVLQIRDWKKDDSPGHLDISVGGHMTSEASGPAEEMLEELNLRESDLEGPLQRVGGYSFDESRPEERFFNSEWRDVYLARLAADSIGRIRFPDGEVAGVVLIPLDGARRLLEQKKVPMASALRESLPKCLGSLGATA